jgi:hypothetical protein
MAVMAASTHELQPSGALGGEDAHERRPEDQEELISATYTTTTQPRRCEQIACDETDEPQQELHE